MRVVAWLGDEADGFFASRRRIDDIPKRAHELGSLDVLFAHHPSQVRRRHLARRGMLLMLSDPLLPSRAVEAGRSRRVARVTRVSTSASRVRVATLGGIVPGAPLKISDPRRRVPRVSGLSSRPMLAHLKFGS